MVLSKYYLTFGLYFISDFLRSNYNYQGKLFTADIHEECPPPRHKGIANARNQLKNRIGKSFKNGRHQRLICQS